MFALSCTNMFRSMRTGFEVLYSNSREEMAKTSGFATSIHIDGLNRCIKVTFNKRLKLLKNMSDIKFIFEQIKRCIFCKVIHKNDILMIIIKRNKRSRFPNIHKESF